MSEVQEPAVLERDEPLVHPGQNYTTITDKISGEVLTRPVMSGWMMGVGIAMGGLMCLMSAIGYLFAKGVGIWGINVPVAWGFDIVNFVWWIGIGHAGTLISAILLLVHQHWRNSINRFAEAMTLFAVACAGLFPILHLGRPYLAYWLGPYPNVMGLWPQFRSPLVWDVFAVTTYLTISFVYWFIGLIPDLASMRDKATKPWLARIYGLLAMGWRGSAKHWHRYETAYLLLGGLATPLVVSVHSVVSFDFSVGIVPGWHSTIFPPYFVAGAVYSGFAMVLTLMIPARKAYGLGDFITMRHIRMMSNIMLATGLVVGYGYVIEVFYSWYSGNPYEKFMMFNRMTGPYRWAYWALIFCNIITPQFLWSRRVKENLVFLWMISIVVNIGMWLERFVIIVVSLHRDFLPSSWSIYTPTVWDWGTYIGTLGLFMFLIFLFVRALPMISIFEIRQLVKSDAKEHH